MIENPTIIGTLGKTEILNFPKTAFLCSRKVPAKAVLRCYDWAIAQRDAGECVISGFHSPLEKDVLHYLLKGNQPIIVACPRGIPQRIDAPLQIAVAEGRMLLVSPFEATVKRISPATATVRNRLMLSLADTIVIGHAAPEGQLAALLSECSKPILYL